MATYTYDAWGKCTIGTNTNNIANINPIRYRGYYYDSESSLYYLNSRYYDPEVGRFLSADNINVAVVVGEYNLYAYCMNDPINSVDPNGYFALTLSFVGGLVVAAGIAILGYSLVTNNTFINSVANGVETLLETIADGMDVMIDKVTDGVSNLVEIYDDFIDKTIIIGGAILAKASKKSQKEMSTDKPSWANEGMVNYKESAKENARRLLDEKYGPGKGPHKEYSEIQKWIERHIFKIKKPLL